jgi:phage FluMu gp28-like protein
MTGRAKIKPPRGFFLPYQKRWIDDGARLKLMEKARQVGLSLSTAYRATEKTADEEAKFDIWVTSRDDLQARLLIEDCKFWANKQRIVSDDLGEVLLEPGRGSVRVLEFANGKRINSLSSNMDAQAGKKGPRVLDEFALHPNPRALYEIAYPGITWGGQLEIISTHRGSGNFFNTLVNEARHKGNPKGFSLHRVTLTDALEQGFLAKLQATLPADDERQAMDEGEYFNFIRAGCADEESFQQEYMCQPADDAAAFLSFDLIDPCTFKGADDLRRGEAPAWFRRWPSTGRGLFAPGWWPAASADLFLGVDLGRTRDLTVLWLIERTGGVLLTRMVIELERTPFEFQEGAFDELMERLPVRRAAVDATGLGMQFAERAQQRFSKYKVEALRFTGPVKEQIAFPVRSAFEDKSLRVPNDRQVIADLRKVRKETTAAGNLRFVAEHDGEASGHADRFWALALAVHAGSHAQRFAARAVRTAARRRQNFDQRREGVWGRGTDRTASGGGRAARAAA